MDEGTSTILRMITANREAIRDAQEVARNTPKPADACTAHAALFQVAMTTSQGMDTLLLCKEEHILAELAERERERQREQRREDENARRAEFDAKERAKKINGAPSGESEPDDHGTVTGSVMGFKIRATGDAAKIVAVILSVAFALTVLTGVVIWQNGKTRAAMKGLAEQAAIEALNQTQE